MQRNQGNLEAMGFSNAALVRTGGTARMAFLKAKEPWKHPKTGVYWCRITVPEALRPFAAGGRGEPQHEYKRSLHTKDRREAARSMLDAVLVYLDYERELEARKAKGSTTRSAAAPTVPTPEALEGGPPVSPAGDLRGLAGDLGNELVERYEGSPPPREAFTNNRSVPPGKEWGDASEPWTYRRYALVRDRRAPVSRAFALEFVTGPAKDFVERRGIAMAQDAWQEFCELARDAINAAYETLQRQYRGDPSAALVRERFPTSAVPAARPKVSLRGIVDVWAKVRSATKSRSLKKYTRRLRELSEFLGHDDALAVESKDLRRWRDHLKALGRSAKTINDDCVGVVVTVFRAAAREEVIPAYPFAGGGFALKEESGKAKRRPYEDDEAARVLTAARKEQSSALRWLPWIMAYTGARVGEVAQLRREDVKERGSIPFFAITDQGEEQSTKTESSVRDVPIHPALRREGFLKFVETVPRGSFLFGDLAGSTQEQRSDSGSRVYMRWLRKTVGITDRRIVGHSWRHRMEDELREVDAPDEVAHAITGRTQQGSRAHYGKGPSLKSKARWLEKVPAVKLAMRRTAA
jgi:integrase